MISAIGLNWRAVFADMLKLRSRGFGTSCDCEALPLSRRAVGVRGPYHCRRVELVATILPAHAEGVAAKLECCE
jgi:hypothetical protein